MNYKLQDLIDLEQFQILQDRLNEIYSFPSAIVDNDGNILTATAWQDVCTLFHRKNKACEKDCIKSDQYIQGHLHEAKPAVSYRCPRGLVDNATPIIIDGIHYGNFFTGQFFLEKPDLEVFRKQATEFGFNEEAYLEAVKKVPVWSQEQLNSYLFFIKGLIAVISESGLKRLHETEARKQKEVIEERANTILHKMHDAFWIIDPKNGNILEVNEALCQMLAYTREEILKLSVADVEANDSSDQIEQRIRSIIQTGSANFESCFRRKDGTVLDIEVSVTYLANQDLLFGFHRDITERNRNEEALRESEIKFRANFESSPIALWEEDFSEVRTRLNELRYAGIVDLGSYLDANPNEVTDLVSKVRVLEVNQASLRALGAESKEQIINDVSYYFAEGSLEVFKKEVVALDEGRTFFESEIPLVNARGENVIHDLSLSVQIGKEESLSRVLVSFVDITQRKHAEELLRQSEDKYRRLVENSPDILYIFSNKQGGTYYSPRIEKVLGYPAEYFYTHPKLWNESIHPDDLDVISQALQASAQGEPFEVDYRIQDSRGQWRWFKDRSIERHTQNDEIFIEGLASDITERKQREFELEAVAAVSMGLRPAHTRADMLPIVTEQVAKLVKAAGVALLFVDEHTEDFMIESADGVWAKEVGKHFPRSTAILRWVLDQGKPYITEDLQNDPNFHMPDAIQNLRGFAEIPLITNDVIIGFLSVASHGIFSDQDIHLLTTIADIVANAVYRVTLHEQTEKYASNLTLAYDTTLEGWAHALELRDQETEGHTRRVAQMTVDLARLIGIDESEIEDIRRGALLHDIGKMGIPDSVLLKPGTLNEREWEIMHRHPEYARELLEPIKYLQPAIDIPYCHHEKWDGSGYPRKLTGEQIPLAARIFAVVDVWDALTSDRPYRPAWSKEKTMEYIIGQKGRHFDPRVTDEFQKMLTGM